MNRILLAEDNPADVYLLREAMSQQGVLVELTVVSDGRKRSIILTPRDPLRDHRCPIYSSSTSISPKERRQSTILRRIREKPEYADIPVVVLTSSEFPKGSQ